MKDLMSKAKIRLLLRHVFFASLALSTPHEKDTTIDTAYTDMTKIVYNPDFVDSLGDVDLALFVEVHELWHIIFEHGFHLDGRDPELANIAQDYAINWMMKGQGFKIWEHAYIDARFDGMSWYQIYDILKKEGKPEGGGGMPGDVRRPPSMDPESKARIKQQIQQKVAQAASMARMAGQLSGVLGEIVGRILNPPLPWQEILQEHMTQVSRDSESWARRDRRHPEIYLPGRHSLRMGEIVFIADVSGSVSDDEARQVAGEIGAVAEFVKPERIRVAYCDTQVIGEQTFEEGEEINLKIPRGGGTDMRVALNVVERYDPVVAVLITDGHTPWPTEEPPYPLIVICTTNQACPVGQVIRMKP